MIFRYKLLGVTQYIVDAEREYNILCKNLGGTVLKIGGNSKTYVNIFDITEETQENEEVGYLTNKINKLMGFFNLIFENLSKSEKSLLEEALIACYNLKGINFDDNSLYEQEDIILDPKFKTSEKMPKIEDLYHVLEKFKLKHLKIKLEPFIFGSLKFFNHHTNISIKDDLIVVDIYELGEENIKYGLYMITELFWNEIKRQRTKNKIIYMDEIWRLIGIVSNKQVANFIYEIFKTIRKYGGSAVAITQDVSDLFSLEDGIYGKSILNNSNIKLIFSLEEESIHVLNQYMALSEKEKIDIRALKRGEAILLVNDEHLKMEVKSADFENEMINKGGIYEKNNYSNSEMKESIKHS